MPLIETPCVKVCVINPTYGLCVGCGRTPEEIEAWIRMGDDERRRIMAELPQRVYELMENLAAAANT